jgi:hypothetical protein
MLAEVFMLRLETIFRLSNPPTPASGDPRFVPIKAPGAPAADGQQTGK